MTSLLVALAWLVVPDAVLAGRALEHVSRHTTGASRVEACEPASTEPRAPDVCRVRPSGTDAAAYTVFATATDVWCTVEDDALARALRPAVAASGAVVARDDATWLALVSLAGSVRFVESASELGPVGRRMPSQAAGAIGPPRVERSPTGEVRIHGYNWLVAWPGGTIGIDETTVRVARDGSVTRADVPLWRRRAIGQR